MHLGNDEKNNKTDEIVCKKQILRMAVELMSHFFLHHKNLKKTKEGMYLRKDDENNEINECLCVTSFVT